MSRTFWPVVIVFIAMLGLIKCSGAQTLDPLVDYRYTGVVVRDSNGDIHRSSKVVTAFRKVWVCPAPGGGHIGPCPGWAVDHVVSLACGGADAVFNMQWLPLDAKSCAADYCKDRWERRVYGGNQMSKGCP